MKLLENEFGEYRVTLFKSGIEIDKNLLKYRDLIENTTEKVKLKSEDEINVNVNFNRVLESTSNQYLFLNEKEEKIARNITDKLLSAKNFINSCDARKFNILISKKLLESIKKNSSLQFNRLVGIAETDNNNSNKEKSFISRLFNKIRKRFTIDKSTTRTINVIELFDQIKILAGKEREFKDRVESYLELIHKAIALNQETQIEKLVSELVIHVYESVLAVSGINRYITISDLITLQKRCEKQLDIDYIRNFTRIIPDSAAEKKVLADNLYVFDNYVVLYYDPSGKSFAFTEREKRELDRIKRDPILFGVIQGSEKLYYIDSWIDELCDLTWDQVVEKLGEEKKL